MATECGPVRGVHTAQFTDSDGYHCVSYRGTTVFRWRLNRLELNTGGWQTVTTKRRMNQALDQFGIDCRISQIDFDWYVFPFDTAERIPFDGQRLELYVSLGRPQTVRPWRDTDPMPD